MELKLTIAIKITLTSAKQVFEKASKDRVGSARLKGILCLRGQFNREGETAIA